MYIYRDKTSCVQFYTKCISLTKYLKSQATAKIGINFIKRIVKSSGCIFHEIHQENDIGLDAIVEIKNEGKATGKLIAIQVKSGNSFFDSKNQKCKMSVNQHYEYWRNHNLKILGIIYVPDLFSAFMIDIKKELDLNSELETIKIPISDQTEFCLQKFKGEIIPNKLNEVSYDELFLKFTDEHHNKSIRLLVNLSRLPLKKAISNILRATDFIEFVRSLNFKVLSKDDFERESLGEQFTSLTNKWHGNLRYSKEDMFYFSEENLQYFDPKFVELKEYLIKNKK